MISLKKITLYLVAALVLAIPFSTQGNVQSETQDLKKLVLAMPLFSADSKLEMEYVALVNQYLSIDDIVFLRGKSSMELYKLTLPKGRVALIRQSIADLEKDLVIAASLDLKISYLCYNLEARKSSHTPAAEKANPVAAVKKARALAKKHNLGLIVVPDSQKTLIKYGSEMAKHADLFAIQLQAWQLLPKKEFQKKASELVSIVKKGNPNIPIIAQLSTAPPSGQKRTGQSNELRPVTAQQMTASVQAIAGSFKGVAFLIFDQGKGKETILHFLSKVR